MSKIIINMNSKFQSEKKAEFKEDIGKTKAQKYINKIRITTWNFKPNILTDL